MSITSKTVKIPFASYIELEEIRLILMKRKLALNKNEVLSFAIERLAGQLRNNENGN